MNPLEGRTKILEFLRDELGWGMATAECWLQASNLNFGGSTPEKLIQRGRSDKVLFFLAWVKQQHPDKMKGKQ